MARLTVLMMPISATSNRLLLSSLVARIGSLVEEVSQEDNVKPSLFFFFIVSFSCLLWLGLRLVVALRLRWVTSTCWCSTILGLPPCSWVSRLLSWLRRLGPSRTLGSHLVLDCFSLLHLGSKTIFHQILKPDYRVEKQC